MKFKYPLAGDTISKNDIDALIDWLSEYPRLTMGELTKKFEREWSNYIGSENSIFVNSGSSANLLMVYLGIVSGNLKKGDRVIVPSCGWATSIAPIIQLGLRPVMVDANRYNFGVMFSMYPQCSLFLSALYQHLLKHFPCRVELPFHHL